MCGGEGSVDSKHYSIKKIFVVRDDKDMEVKLESLWETGLG